MSVAAPDPLQFDRFAIDPVQRQVLLDGAPAALGARAFDVLMALVERRERVVSKNELIDVVWPDVVVEENNLQVHISALRKLLGPQTIATIPGRGYQFVAPLARPLSGATPAPESAQPARTNLPAQLPSLIGRAADAAALARLLDAHSLVTIVGPGGIGKTRLALAVAQARLPDLADGAWFIDLAALAEPGTVATLVAHTLAIELTPGRAPEATVAAALRAQSMLLLLDNCEHVLDAASALVAALRTRAPHVCVLATSREPLRLAGEQVMRLEPLALPPPNAPLDPGATDRYGAIDLFVARAQAADRRFALSHANLRAVTEICRHLDGLPLAIELAAARLPLLGVDGLRDRLGDRLRVLIGGGRDAPARQQTLRSTLAWSYALLDADEQAVFRRLGVFVGGFSVELAQRVLAAPGLDEWTVLDRLGALVDKSLVIAEGALAPRYRLLESARAFALEELARTAELEELRRRHALALRDMLEAFDRAVALAPRFDALTAPLAGEFDNLNAALAWASSAPAERDTALALAGAGDWLWNEFDRFGEGLQWCRRVAPRLDAAAPLALAARFRLAYAGLGRVSMLPAQEWVALARQALADFRALGERTGQYRALCLLSGPSGDLVSLAEVGKLLEEAAAIEDPAWSPRMRLRRQTALEWWHDLSGRMDAACVAGREHVALARAAGGAAEIGACSNLADSEFERGNVDAAIALCRRSIARAAELGRAGGVYHAYANIVPALLARGDLAQAEQALRTGRALYVRGVGTAFTMLVPAAVLLQRRGAFDLAARLIGCADRHYAQGGHVLHPPERRMRERLLADLQAQLAPAQVQAWCAEGATWGEDEAFERAGLA